MSGGNPTNKDIMQILGRIEQKVDTVSEQQAKTNGRVTTIENWKNAIQAVEAYKKEQVPSVQTEHGNVIVQATANKLDAQAKLFIAIATLVTTVAAGIGIWGR